MSGTGDVRYLYDGTWEGLLCCVYESVYGREVPAAICAQHDAEPSLFQDRWISSDAERARRVSRSIPEKICPQAAVLVRDVFCSCAPDREMLILRFLLFGYKRGRQACYMRGHAYVAPLYEAQRHLANEVHLLLGFLRFSDVGGVLVATITPKNFVLPYLREHFCGRYAAEEFLIFDKRHGAALVWQAHRASLIPLEALELPPPDADEAQFRALWKRFYEAIGIRQRENPVCRRTHCPVRYWENMTEFQDLGTETAGLPRRLRAETGTAGARTGTALPLQDVRRLGGA